MDKKQLTTILYLVASLVLFLTAILKQNPVLVPMGVFFLVLGGFHSGFQNEKGV